MRTAAALLLVLGLAAPAAIVEGPAPLEDLVHHGVRHVDDEADGHHHGDADDHHEEPGSPCHHHEDHFCSGHGHDAAFFVASDLMGPGLARAPRPIVVEPLDPHSLHRVFHIPIA